MSRDKDLLRMAKESGLTDPDLGDWMIDYGRAEDSIKKFAELVATKEREACAQIADDAADSIGPVELDVGAAVAAAIRARSIQ